MEQDKATRKRLEGTHDVDRSGLPIPCHEVSCEDQSKLIVSLGSEGGDVLLTINVTVGEEQGRVDIIQQARFDIIRIHQTKPEIVSKSL